MRARAEIKGKIDAGDQSVVDTLIDLEKNSTAAQRTALEGVLPPTFMLATPGPILVDFGGCTEIVVHVSGREGPRVSAMVGVTRAGDLVRVDTIDGQPDHWRVTGLEPGETVIELTSIIITPNGWVWGPPTEVTVTVLE